MQPHLADIWCRGKFDGAWWVHSGGEEDWDVVAAPGGRRWSRLCVAHLHCSAGSTQSSYAGKDLRQSAGGTTNWLIVIFQYHLDFCVAQQNIKKVSFCCRGKLKKICWHVEETCFEMQMRITSNPTRASAT